MAGSHDTSEPVGWRKCAELVPPPAELLDQPLEYIFAEHFRHRCICALMRRIADERQCSSETAGRIVAFLAHDLVLHHQDEEDCVFPLVLKRSVPEDGLAPIIEKLADDHRRTQRQAGKIMEALPAAATTDDTGITARTAEMMLTYARNEHRHLAIENGIVLVIARKRLKSADLAAIAHDMRARRGMQA